jgi:valyl-tRNA synthetase
MIKRLARISDLGIGRMAKPEGAAASVVGDLEVYVPLEGIIDLKKERERLEKEQDRVAALIGSTEARLKDKSFVSKAPKDVVEKQRSQLSDLKGQFDKLRANLKTI